MSSVASRERDGRHLRASRSHTRHLAVMQEKRLTPRYVEMYVAPIVPLSVYKNGPALPPSLGPATTKSRLLLPKCMGLMISIPNTACGGSV